MIYITPKLDSVYERDDHKFNLSARINEKSFTKSDTPLSYRQINTLSKDKLFPEDRDNKKGWRKFSHKELIYFSIIYELKKFGLAHDVLKNLSDSFFKEPVPSEKLQTNKYTSDLAIGCVLVQAEIMLTIKSNGEVNYYDPPHYLLLGREENPTIQIRLNDVVNTVNKKIGQKLIPIKWSGRDYLWNRDSIRISDKEKEIISIIRKNDYSTIKIKKANGQASIIQAEKAINADHISKQEILHLLEAKDFQDISIVRRDGNIVSFKIEENIKLVS